MTVAAYLPPRVLTRVRTGPTVDIFLGKKYPGFSILQHDPEKWVPVFGQDHAQIQSLIAKSGCRFSDKIVLKYRAWSRKVGTGFGL